MRVDTLSPAAAVHLAQLALAYQGASPSVAFMVYASANGLFASMGRLEFVALAVAWVCDHHGYNRGRAREFWDGQWRGHEHDGQATARVNKAGM